MITATGWRKHRSKITKFQSLPVEISNSIFSLPCLHKLWTWSKQNREYRTELHFFTDSVFYESIPQSKMTVKPCSKIFKKQLFADFFLFFPVLLCIKQLSREWTTVPQNNHSVLCIRGCPVKLFYCGLGVFLILKKIRDLRLNMPSPHSVLILWIMCHVHNTYITYAQISVTTVNILLKQYIYIFLTKQYISKVEE